MPTSTTSEVLTVSASWSSLPTLVGREFRSGYLQIDHEHQQFFEKAAYLDRNDHEMREEFFDEDLVEGIHLLGVIDHLTNSVLYVAEAEWAGWNYGYDRVRFVSEVSTRDRIRVAGSIAAVVGRGNGFVVTLDCVLEVEGREKPGAIVQWKVLWKLG